MRKTIPELRRELARMPQPLFYSDGACKACLGIGLCKYHQVESAIREREQSANLAKVCEHIRADKLARTQYQDGCDLNHNED